MDTARREPLTVPHPPEEITTREVIEAFHALRLAFEIDNPFELPPDDSRVAEVNELLIKWDQAREAKLSRNSTSEARIRHNVEEAMLYIEAGFHAREYVYVVYEWLEDALASANERELSELSAEIRAKIKVLDDLLANQSS